MKAETLLPFLVSNLVPLMSPCDILTKGSAGSSKANTTINNNTKNFNCKFIILSIQKQYLWNWLWKKNLFYETFILLNLACVKLRINTLLVNHGWDSDFIEIFKSDRYRIQHARCTSDKTTLSEWFSGYLRK